MSYVSVYIHCVWSTKNRQHLLNSKELRYKVWTHIKENAKEKGIFIDFINGYSDHCHCLISLTVDQTIKKTMQLIKGESSYWINKNKLIEEKFKWQDEYYAVSICPTQADEVRDYIKNQEIHHTNKSFQEEYNEFIRRYGFERLIG